MMCCSALSFQRLYSQPHEQFPINSEHLILPNISFLSIHMGKVTYSHLPLLLESMKYNSPQMQFTLINILAEDNLSDSNELKSLIRKMSVTNFHIHTMTYSMLSERVRDKIGMQTNISIDTWS